jgi:hypothetical protein
VPSGVWDESEYRKLPEYDKETGEQPPAVFMCHQQDGCLCAGWVAVHSMVESLGLRFALSMGVIDRTESVIKKIFNYTTDVPLFASGQEAMEHGLKNLQTPDTKANAVIRKLTTRKKLQSIAKRRSRA